MTLALKASGTGSIQLAWKASKQTCLESKQLGIESHCGEKFFVVRCIQVYYKGKEMRVHRNNMTLIRARASRAGLQFGQWDSLPSYNES